MYCYKYSSKSQDCNKIAFLKRADGGLYLAIGYCTGAAKLKPSDCAFSYEESSYANAITGLYFSLSKSNDWQSDKTYGIVLNDT